MDIYFLNYNQGLRWHTTKYAHYISLWFIQINISKGVK